MDEKELKKGDDSKMESVKKKHIIYRPVNGGNYKKKSYKERPFHMIKSSTRSRRVSRGKVGSREQLVDILNLINFQDGTIRASFRHAKFNRSIARSVYTRLCHGNRLDCIWANKAGIHQIIKSYKFQSLLISDGNNLLLVYPELIDIDKHGISFTLPDTYSEIGKRKVKRHSCTGIDVQMVQDSTFFNGTLADFSPMTFKVVSPVSVQQPSAGINPDARINLIFSSADESLYSSECRILRQNGGPKAKTYIFEPIHHQIQKFKPSEHRSSRLSLVPTPDIIFEHPFTGKVFNRKVLDISGSGFAVEEAEESSTLLPGMIIPELQVGFAGGLRLNCRAQVVYRKLFGKNINGNIVKCGIAIIDITPFDHMKLLAILSQAENKNSYIDNKIDIDASWDFFFKTGLIKPEEYTSIKAKKEKIKKTYKKLYDCNPDLARHFIYQTNDTIKGHMAMLRFYENSWLIHHEAAGSPIIEARLGVLNRIAQFIYDSHRFSSIHMDFVINYFDKDNKFSDLVFKGAAHKINDPKGCSLDSFAYFRYREAYPDAQRLSKPWRLTKALPQDLMELKDSYRIESKGLMIEALDLLPHMNQSRGLSEEYQKLGLKRGKYLLSLKKVDMLKAVIMVNVSDVGLTSSNMTSCIKVFILDQEYLPQEILYSALSQILTKIRLSEIPVLLFPHEYANHQAITVEKQYYQWILNTQYSDQFFSHIKQLVKK
ncbi:MAG: hypothetical protein JRI61_08505 [Deltaproteobacteria bacterium]|nr:hypothetical protein [Deltaproteobacteria bacterium]